MFSSALASPEFEHRQGEELGHHLAHRLAEAFRNDVSVDLASLSVIPGNCTENEFNLLRFL